METADLISLIEQLDDNIDDLEEALAPLLKSALSDTAGKLPLLDKAHLYVLSTYAIESILFSYLRLNGVNAREHPVFRELTRVKQYFDKLKVAETGPAAPSTKLDREAAGRFIKHALAGNDKHDTELAKQQSLKKTPSHVRFQEAPQTVQSNDNGGSAQRTSASEEDSDSDSLNPMNSQTNNATLGKSAGSEASETKDSGSRKRKKGRNHASEAPGATNAIDGESKRERKKKKKLRKAAKLLKASQESQNAG